MAITMKRVETEFDYVRPLEVHQKLGIPLGRVYTLMYKGLLPAVQIGKCSWFIKRADFRRFKKRYSAKRTERTRRAK